MEKLLDLWETYGVGLDDSIFKQVGKASLSFP